MVDLWWPLGWIPGPYGVTPVYAPALVAWIGGGRGGSGFSMSFSIGTAAAVAWFPLGPREPYFPSYQVSQGYFSRVNNTNTVINSTSINRYYAYSRTSNNDGHGERPVREPPCAKRRHGDSAGQLRQRKASDSGCTAGTGELNLPPRAGLPRANHRAAKRECFGARADTASGLRVPRPTC